MYLFNGICLTDNLVKNLHRKVTQENKAKESSKQNS